MRLPGVPSWRAWASGGRFSVGFLGCRAPWAARDLRSESFLGLDSSSQAWLLWRYSRHVKEYPSAETHITSISAGNGGSTS